MICYYAVPKSCVAARRYILMVFSFLFYACGEPIYFFAILFCVFITWAVSNGIANKKKFPYLIALAVNLVPLIIYKYLDFIILNVNNVINYVLMGLNFGIDLVLPVGADLIPLINIPPSNLVMPIGISFYTFQMLTYVIDLYRGEVKRQRNFGYLALYIFLFPQLIAGPIVRYQDVEVDIGRCNENWDSIKAGAARFIKGLAKKMLIANQVCYICDTITANDLGTISVPMMWLAVLSYAIQIYFDFSGYSDMAIGLGKMFGFEFLENFNLPYSSLSISEFWRRWHISMNTFFRDYIYIPLGGSRVSKGRWVFNTLVVWGITGLWHGAAWNFIVWGLYYAVLLMMEKFFMGAVLKKIPKIFSWCYMFFFTLIGFSFFMHDSNSLADMFAFTFRLFGVGEVANAVTVRSLELEAYIPYILVALVFCLPTRNIFKKIFSALDNVKSKVFAIPYGIVCDAVYIVAFICCIGFVVGGSYNPFIYFRF